MKTFPHHSKLWHFFKSSKKSISPYLAVHYPLLFYEYAKQTTMGLLMQLSRVPFESHFHKWAFFFQVAFHGFMSYNKSEQKTSRGVSLSPYTKIHTGLSKLNGLLIKKEWKRAIPLCRVHKAKPFLISSLPFPLNLKTLRYYKIGFISFRYNLSSNGTKRFGVPCMTIRPHFYYTHRD